MPALPMSCELESAGSPESSASSGMVPDADRASVAAEGRPDYFDGGWLVTLIWFVVWLIADNVGEREPLIFDPVNLWAGALILAIAIDLGSHHAAAQVRRPRSRGSRNG
ncbi:MAG: hypothetical protein OEM67_04430 [Thermoleophilia bacterium]|nr:hypothetical protein [Thermoleophilia bacterium]